MLHAHIHQCEEFLYNTVFHSPTVSIVSLYDVSCHFLLRSIDDPEREYLYIFYKKYIPSSFAYIHSSIVHIIKVVSRTTFTYYFFNFYQTFFPKLDHMSKLLIKIMIWYYWCSPSVLPFSYNAITTTSFLFLVINRLGYFFLFATNVLHTYNICIFKLLFPDTKYPLFVFST